MAITTKMLGRLGGVKQVELTNGQSTPVPAGKHMIGFEALGYNARVNIGGASEFSVGANPGDTAMQFVTGPTSVKSVSGGLRVYIARL